MQLTIGSKRHIGAREDQQDSVIVLRNNDDIFIALGDGMGGHAGGAKASNFLVTIAQNEFENSEHNDAKVFFNRIIHKTQQELSIYKDQSGEDAHTTAAFALIKDNTVHYANIGDSRIYIFENNKLITRSRDHSVPEMLLQQGEISEEEMATHPDQNKLTKSVSGDTPVNVSYGSVNLTPGVRYLVLVCSDGFWEYVKQEEMVYWNNNFTVENAMNKMIQIARKRGGSKGDNISLAIANVATDKIKQIKKIRVFNRLSFILLFLLVLGVSLGFLSYFSFFNSSDNNATKNNLTKQVNQNKGNATQEINVKTSSDKEK